MAPSRETKAHCGACRAICLFATFFAILLSDCVSLVARAKVPPPTATIRAITEIARAGVGRLRSLLSIVGTPLPVQGFRRQMLRDPTPAVQPTSCRPLTFGAVGVGSTGGVRMTR